MKFTSVSTVVSLAVLTPTILADFTIYISGIGGNGISGNTVGWQVYPTTDGVLPCDDPLEWIWRDSDDVSGLKYGVRCDGDGSSCSRSSSGNGISELEFNTRQYGDDTSPHFTFYSDRDGALVDLDGGEIGRCTSAPEENFYCGTTAGSRTEGTRKLDCMSDLTVEDFTNARPT